MKCPNCRQTVEASAAFCGNCGHQLIAAPQLPTVQDHAPTYAVATHEQHAGETQALLAVLCGVLGLLSALIAPAIALGLGIAGLVFGTISRDSRQRRLSTIGIVLSVLAVLVGLLAWGRLIANNPRFNHKATSTQASSGVTSKASLSTPCYSASFVDRLNVTNAAGSCTASAFNGDTLDESSNAYKVYSHKAQIASVSSFTSLAKQALEKDVKDSLPGFTIDNERVSGFAGSPAYTVSASNKSQGVAVVETAVYHQASKNDNVFILVHAVNGSTTDMSILESQWQWK